MIQEKVDEFRHRAYELRDELAIRSGAVPQTQALAVDGHGAQFYVQTREEWGRIKSAVGEREVLRRLLRDIESGDTFWDVGSCVGTYACLAAAAGAETVAFEPHPKNFARLVENIELNGFSVDARQVALGESPGTVHLSEGGAVGAGGHRVSSKGIAVDIVRPDDIEAPSPDILKIDVEGHEIEVLRGASEVLSNARLLFVETHPQFGVSPEEVKSLLSDHGFTVTEVESEREETFVWAEK